MTAKPWRSESRRLNGSRTKQLSSDHDLTTCTLGCAHPFCPPPWTTQKRMHKPRAYWLDAGPKRVSVEPPSMQNVWACLALSPHKPRDLHQQLCPTPLTSDTAPHATACLPGHGPPCLGPTQNCLRAAVAGSHGTDFGTFTALPLRQPSGARCGLPGSECPPGRGCCRCRSAACCASRSWQTRGAWCSGPPRGSRSRRRSS